jgi:hypothetical protein
LTIARKSGENLAKHTSGNNQIDATVAFCARQRVLNIELEGGTTAIINDVMVQQEEPEYNPRSAAGTG